MSVHYQRFLKILEKWPVDSSKSGRDLGEHLRKKAQLLLKSSVSPQQDSEKFSEQLDALERLSNNVHYNNLKRTQQSTATGLTAEQCHQVLSAEFLYYLNDKK